MRQDKELRLTSTQVMSFMQDMGLNPNDNPTAENLRNIVKNFLERVPFQNLTMLTGPMSRPTWDQICEEMLCGNGGLCTTRNPFLKVLLSHLGYTTTFVTASMEKPNCHIGILVRLNDVDYWVDVGNGYPYIEPYPLGSDVVVTHSFFDYKVIESEGIWQVQHRFNGGHWRTNQSFENRAVPYEFFDEMHELHYKEIGWGPFLTGLRVNRWTKNGGLILRDGEAITLSQQTTIESAEDLRRWINQTFPGAPFGAESTVQKAWDTYCHRKQELSR